MTWAGRCGSRVTIALTPDAFVNVAPTTLVFTPADYNLAQTVTVSLTLTDDLSGVLFTSPQFNYSAFAFKSPSGRQTVFAIRYSPFVIRYE